MSAKYDARVAGALAAGTPNLEGIEGYAAAAAWLHKGQGDLSDVPETTAMSAIEAAIRLRKTDLLAALETGPKALRKAGRAGLHRLKAAGVVAEVPRQTANFSLGREVVTVPPRAVMSTPDMGGLTQIAMTCTDDEGTCAVIGVFGGREGVRKLEHGHLSRGSARKFFDDLLSQRGVYEVPFTHALHHAPQGVATAEQLGGIPHDWEHFSEHLTAAHKAAAEAYSPLGELPEVPEEGRLAATDALAQLLGNVPWAVSQSAFFDLDARLDSVRQAVAAVDALEQGEFPAEGEQAEAQGAPAEGAEAPEQAEAPAQDEAPDQAEAPEQAEAAAETDALDDDAIDASLAEQIANPENTFWDAVRIASAKVLDDEEVRADWQHRLALFATLFRQMNLEEPLTDLQHIAAALRDRVPAERIGLSQAMMRSALFTSMMNRMEDDQPAQEE